MAGDASNSLLPCSEFQSACLCGEKRVVRDMLNGSKLISSQPDKFGRDGLMYSAMGGDRDIAQLLVAHGSRVCEATKHGCTLLHIAATWGAVDICSWLVSDMHSDINAQDRNGRTPLHLACLCGHVEAAIFLLRAVLSSSYKLPLSKTGDSPFHVATMGGYIELFECMLTELDCVGNRGTRTPQINSIINQPNNMGRTCLHIAVAFDRLDMAMFLIKNGADCGLESKDGHTALTLASHCKHVDMAIFLALPPEEMEERARLRLQERSREIKHDSKDTYTPTGLPTSPKGLTNTEQTSSTAKPVENRIQSSYSDDDSRRRAHALAITTPQIHESAKKQLLATEKEFKAGLALPTTIPYLPATSNISPTRQRSVRGSAAAREGRLSGGEDMSQPSPRARTSLMSAQLSVGGDTGKAPRNLLSPRGGGRLVPLTRRVSADSGGTLVEPNTSISSTVRRYTFDDFEDMEDSASESGRSSRRESRNTMDSIDSADGMEW